MENTNNVQEITILDKESVRNTIVNGTWITNGSMKGDKDSTNAKKFTLKVQFNNVNVYDIIQKALEPTKIAWVNGVGRPKIATWKDNETITIDFKSPAKAPAIDPKDAIKLQAMAEGVNVSDKKAFSEWLKVKFNI